MQELKPWWCHVNGLCGMGGFVGRQTAVELCRDGVALRHDPSGAKHFIPTERRPEPGLKVTALIPLAPLFETGLIERREPTGCGVRIATTLARRLRAAAGGTVQLLNSGSPSASLDDYCAHAGLECRSLGRQAAPHTILVPLPTDRLVLREQVQPCPPRLSDAERQRLARGLAEAGAAVSASPRDAALTAASLALSNGARRYFQATGSVGPEMTFLFLTTAHEVIANFDEWARIGRWAGLAVPDFGEDSPDAPSAAAALLRALKDRHWVASEAAVCTLGRHGAVVMNWRDDRACHIALEMLDHPSVDTPVGTGDLFLAEWIFWRETWSRQGHLRDPLAATGLRVTHIVAGVLGLRRGDYDVRVVPL